MTSTYPLYRRGKRSATRDKCIKRLHCYNRMQLHLIILNDLWLDLKINIFNHFIFFRITFGSSENPRTSTDKSIIMNALAMKYLPCDLNNSQSPKSSQNAVTHTTPINTARNAAPTTASTPTTPPSTSPIHDHSDNRHNEFDGKNYTTDMSVSSYRYMQKYGLL